MRALVLEAPNGAWIEREMDRPVAGPGQVLVRIMASSVNPLDLKIRAGDAEHARERLPAILGIDMAGIVESTGSGVLDFEAGDAVYGATGGVGGVQGSLADFAAVDAGLLARQPKGFSMREAAALPLTFITAWEGLVDRARLQPGQRVLVHAGAGGVGHMAIQIARALGAQVFATVSKSKTKIVEDYGATAIDYHSESVAQYVAAHTNSEGFDVVYDTVGAKTLDESFLAVRRYGGHVVSCLGWGTHALAPLSFRAATYSGVFALIPLLTGVGRAHHGEILREATKLAEAGLLHPLVRAETYTFKSATEAYLAAGSAGGTGKIIIDVPDPAESAVL